MCVATCANVTAALVASGVDPGPPVSGLWAVAVLAVAAGVGVLLARRLGGRYAVALALAWGLVWIAVGRVTDQPRSAVTAAAAVVAAVVVVTAAAQVRLRAVDRAEAALSLPALDYRVAGSAGWRPRPLTARATRSSGGSPTSRTMPDSSGSSGSSVAICESSRLAGM